MITREFRATKPVEFYHYLIQESKKRDVIEPIYTYNGVSVYHVEQATVTANIKGEVYITTLESEENNVAKFALERLVKIGLNPVIKPKEAQAK